MPLLVLALACQKSERPSATLQPNARQTTPLGADTVWIRGGRKADHALRYPEYLAHDSTQIYVTDMASHQVMALDQRTGAINWTTSNASGDLRAPGSIAGLPGGGVAVLAGVAFLIADSSGGSSSALHNSPHVTPVFGFRSLGLVGTF